MFRVLEALRWQVPDWIVVPGGNLGNSSAFGKAFQELLKLGLIDRAPTVGSHSTRRGAIRCISYMNVVTCAGMSANPIKRRPSPTMTTWIAAAPKRTPSQRH